MVISQQPDQNMSKSLLEYDSYVLHLWVLAVLTILLVGTSAMAESSFADITFHKYGLAGHMGKI